MNPDKNIILKIKTTGLDLTSAIEEYTRAKIKMLEKFLSHFAKESGELIFDIELERTTEHHRSGDVFRCEINFTADGARMRSEATKDDLYAAIDEAKDEMSRELRKTKNKHITLLRRGGAAIKRLFRRH